MTLTAEQIETRRKHVGSSDAPDIILPDDHPERYRTLRDLYAEKIGLVPAFGGNERTRIGNLVEPALVQRCAEELQVTVRPAVHMIADDQINACNLDAMIVAEDVADPEQHIEAKSSGAAGYGDQEIANDVPLRVLIQTHHQFYVADTRIAWVPVLVGRFGLSFRLYRVDRDDELAEEIGERCRAFYEDHVMRRREPDGPISLDTAKRLQRVEGKEIIVADDFWQARHALDEQLKDARAALKAIEQQREHLDAELLAMMGDAEIGRTNMGLFQYRTQFRKGYSVKPTSFRVLRMKAFNKESTH